MIKNINNSILNGYSIEKIKKNNDILDEPYEEAEK